MITWCLEASHAAQDLDAILREKKSLLNNHTGVWDQEQCQEYQWPINRRFVLQRRSSMWKYQVIHGFEVCSSEGATSRKKKCVLIAPDCNLVLYLRVSGFVPVHNGSVECFPAVLQCTLLNNREIIYWREWTYSCISLFCIRSFKDMKAAIILTLANTIKKF